MVEPEILYAGDRLPRENLRDLINEFRTDCKFRWVPFRGYYRYRSRKYLRRIDPEMGLIRFMADPRRVSIDVGANLGLFTYYLARHSTHVHAFEPNPVPLRALGAVVDANVTIHQVALTDRTGDVDLIVPKSRKGWSSNGAKLDVSPEGRHIVARVPGRRLDGLDLGEIGFIKIDVEGHELAVLAGARETIARDRPNLFIEAEYAHVGDRVAELFELVGGLGYDGYFLEDGVMRNISHFSIEAHQLAPRRGEGPHRYVKNFLFFAR